jgi:renalase
VGHAHPKTDHVDIAILGAGVAGLAAAEALKTFAPQATLRILEKNPVPGGRLASRQGQHQVLDTTAQFFTARSPEFKTLVQFWEKQGWLRTWFTKPNENGQPEPGYASPLGMGTLMAHWALRHDVRCGQNVLAIETHATDWHLHLSPTVFAAPHGLRAQAVLITSPWPQAQPMVQGHLTGSAIIPETVAALASIRYAPCLVLEVEWNGDSDVHDLGLQFMPSPDIVCIADQQSKGLPAMEKATGQGHGMVFLMTPDFSEAHWPKSDAELLSLLVEKARPWVASLSDPLFSLGRWPHARVLQAFGKPFLDCGTAAPLFVAGDGFGGARVEGAFTSGWEAGKALAMRLQPR